SPDLARTRQIQFYLRPRGRASPELLGKRDDEALRAADVAEPVRVLVLDDLAHELGAMGEQAREDVLDVVHGEHDATYAERVPGRVLRLRPARRRRVELVQLGPAVAGRGPQHRDLAPDLLDPDGTVHPGPLEGHLSLQLHPEL